MTEGVKIAIGLNTRFRKHSMENTPTFSLGDFHIVNRICFIPAQPAWYYRGLLSSVFLSYCNAGEHISDI